MTSENATVVDKQNDIRGSVNEGAVSDDDVVCLQGSPGEQLRAAREVLGLSLEQVAEQLHMAVAKVRYLENDEYERLPQSTFVQGYIRSYSRLLKLNPGRLVKDYEDFICRLEGTTKQLAQEPEVTRPKTSTQRLLIPAVLVILGTIAVLFFFFAQDDKDAAVIQSGSGSAAEQPVAIPDLPPTAAETLGGAGVSANSDSTSSVSLEGAGSSDAGAGGRESHVLTNALVPPAISALKFVFSAECWVEVTDATGKKILAELKNVGDLAEVSGEPPFDIVLGNARAAQVWIDGQAVALDISPSRKLLRLTLAKPVLSDLPASDSF